jgi:hypothetical protein
MAENLVDQQESSGLLVSEPHSHRPRFQPRLRLQRLAICGLLAFAAILVHGFHPFSEDAAVYVPAIKKQLDPSLFPKGAEFFESSARLTVFTRVIAQTVRLTHAPITYVLLGWYFFSIFLLLTAAWRICVLCHPDPRAPFLGVFLLTAILTIPIAGTSLLLSDPYLTSRSLSTPVLLYAVARTLERRFIAAGLWLLLGVAIHPLMAAFTAAFMLVHLAVKKRQWRLLFLVGASFGIFFLLVGEFGMQTPVLPSYRAAVLTRTYFFLNNWTWYELVGIAAPIAIFAWVAWDRRNQLPSQLRACAISVSIYALFFSIAAIAVTFDSNLILLARYQPMRSFHLVYLLLFLLPVTSVLLRLLRTRPLVATALFVALCSIMFVVQRKDYPATTHVQWPWKESGNPWQQAFDWIRVNTPKTAVFALDPNYMDIPQEDHQGFRACAERSTLADRAKDGGVAALFPAISDDWSLQTTAAASLEANSQELQPEPMIRSGANWIVTRNNAPGLDCPYRNSAVAVCNLASSTAVAAERSRALK